MIHKYIYHKMAFNSDFIQASTLTSLVRSTIGGHILQNNSSDALELSGLSGVMELTQLNSSVVNADSLIACSQFEPAVSGDPIVLNSDVSLANFNLNNVTDINFSSNGTVTGLTSISSDGVKVTIEDVRKMLHQFNLNETLAEEYVERTSGIHRA